MSADNSAQIKSSKQALIYVCGFIAKKLSTKVPGLVRGSEDKTNCDWIDLKSRGSLVYPPKDLLEEVEKIFQKIHGESLDRGRDPIEKTFSAIAAISNRWPREVIKLFVNVRFFSRLKKLNVIFKEKSKNNVRTLKQTAQFMF